MGMHEMWVAVALLCCWFGAGIEAQGDVRSKLSTQFYQRTCPGVEQVVASTMFRHLQQDITSGAPCFACSFTTVLSMCATILPLSLLPIAKY